MSDTFTNLLLLQRFFAHALLCDSYLVNVNVVTRDQLLENKSRLPDDTIAAESLVYITERNSRSGAGVIVEKPEIAAKFLDEPGPQGDVMLSCLVIEDPLQNEDPASGTLRAADQIGQKILDLGHQFVIESLGVFSAAPGAMKEAKEWQPLRAWNVNLKMMMNRRQTDRVSRVQFAWGTPPSTGPVMLTCDTPGADIFYTLDGSFPGASNPTAKIYVLPFDADPGAVIFAAAFKPGMIQSAVARRVAGSPAP